VVGTSAELDAPVIAFVELYCTLEFHCCRQVGEESVEPPNIDGKSTTQSFAFFVVIVTVGLLTAVLFFDAVLEIGLV